MTASHTRQATFKTPSEKARDVLQRAAQRDFDTVLCGVSGGTDSVLATHITTTLGAQYGIRPDAIVHANTGLAVPQTRLVAQLLAAIHDLPYIEASNRTLAPRVLERGWPMIGKKGHFFERIERKEDVFDDIHTAFSTEQLWISGARIDESDERKMNVPDSGVESDSRRVRQTWVSPIAGFTTGEKWDWIERDGLPVSGSYEWLGFSGECVACSYDDVGILTELDIIAPHVSFAARLLTAWLVMRVRREDVDNITPKLLCWGWDPDADDTPDENIQQDLDGDHAVDNAWVGCGSDSCKDRDRPDRVFDLPDWQIVDRSDVLKYVDGGGSMKELIARFE